MKKEKFILAANWKMNPTSFRDAKNIFSAYQKLAKQFSDFKYLVAVPAVFIQALAKTKRPKNLSFVAEDIFSQNQGSYTGALSVPMFQSIGTAAVLIGHSERRKIFGESEIEIENKIKHAMEHKMPMIVCLGESVRDENGDYTDVLEKQLETILQPFVTGRKTNLLTLAYEPVWAIGKEAQRPITADELFSTLLLIRKIATKFLGEGRAKNLPILYGGSVNPDNAKTLAQVPGVDGFLIGRASLDRKKMKQISQAVV